MPILSPIQRRSPGGRLLVGGMYLFLIIGSVWMVYPFLLMLSGSVKSGVDIRNFDIFPRYLTDEELLFCKFEQQRYGSLDAFTAVTRYHDAEGRPAYSFEFLKPPAASAPAALEDWREFLRESSSWPRPFLQLGHSWAQRSMSELGVKYQHRLWDAFPNVPKDEISGYISNEGWQSRSYQNNQGEYTEVYEEFRKSVPARYFISTTIEGMFILRLPAKYGFGADAVAKLNQSWGTQYASLYDVKMSPTPPTQAGQREDWWDYVRKNLSARFINLSPSLLPGFQNSLKSKYGDLTGFNKVYGSSYTSWSQIPFPSHPATAAAFNDAESFVETRASPEGISIDSPDFRWREFLRKKYGGDLEALNRALGKKYASFESVPQPVYEYDWELLKKNRGAIRREFLTRNYIVVWDFLAGRGRALQNTILFCVLNVLTALIVNPIAAYGLSRFQPRWGYKVLFLLMATMAFPGEVTQIPAFLMLREMGMLNTYAALVIPAAANGFFIFLLKGFFDSLPKDLYESATLDGASELRIFATITMPLSTPILAVIALGAFTSAYGAFMFALLVCQKESMWTLMVHVYQLQIYYDTPIILASLVLAAVPTLLVFVFCQNIIMKGIVVPVEK